MSTSVSKTRAFPSWQKYRNWSKQLLQDNIAHDKALLPYLSFDSNYSLNPQMVALYNFSKAPLFGKYKSVIFDKEQGIVLSKRSSCSLVTALVKNNLILSLPLQKELSRQLGFRSNHVIATGKLAYFSMHGYTNGNNDWVSLHQMVSYRPVGQGKFRFKSVKLNNVTYTFSFEDCARHLFTKISDSLYHNHVIFKLLHAHLSQSLGWQYRQTKGVSLVDKREYCHPHPAITVQPLPELYQAVLSSKQAIYHKQLVNWYELDLPDDNQQLIGRLSQRSETLY